METVELNDLNVAARSKCNRFNFEACLFDNNRPRSSSKASSRSSLVLEPRSERIEKSHFFNQLQPGAQVVVVNHALLAGPTPASVVGAPVYPRFRNFSLSLFPCCLRSCALFLLFFTMSSSPTSLYWCNKHLGNRLCRGLWQNSESSHIAAPVHVFTSAAFYSSQCSTTLSVCPPTERIRQLFSFFHKRRGWRWAAAQARSPKATVFHFNKACCLSLAQSRSFFPCKKSSSYFAITHVQCKLTIECIDFLFITPIILIYWRILV